MAAEDWNDMWMDEMIEEDRAMERIEGHIWMTDEGEEIHVTKMKQSHLNNVYKMLKYKRGEWHIKEWRKIIHAELRKRGNVYQKLARGLAINSLIKTAEEVNKESAQNLIDPDGGFDIVLMRK